MDIVTRLKDYIGFENVTLAQFADSCGIPRPTLSQLLNGRNKKVSDELISKIHDAYPRLSVMWLMFGEGDMLINGNIKISEPQNSLFDDEMDILSADIENVIVQDKDNENADIIVSDKKSATYFDSQSTTNNTISPDISEESAITLNTNQTKKIINIIVYYSDNSFESFIPDPHKK